MKPAEKTVLSQENHSGLNFYYFRVKEHQQKRCVGEASREASLRGTLHMSFLLRSALGAGWDLLKRSDAILAHTQLLLECYYQAFFLARKLGGKLKRVKQL